MSISTQNPKACQHPPAARYWDTDEERCRVCSTSLTFPPRPPEPDDTTELKRDKRITAGEKHRVTAVEVAGVTAVEVVEVEDGLLRCSCCGLSLVPEDFSVRNDPAAKNRSYRASACRRCQASKVRAKRKLNPKTFLGCGTGSDRRDAQASLTPAQREMVRQKRRESHDAILAATRRWQARQKGVSIPLRLQWRENNPSRGTPGCPLGESCTGKSGKGQEGNPMTTLGLHAAAWLNKRVSNPVVRHKWGKQSIAKTPGDLASYSGFNWKDNTHKKARGLTESF